jgi:hypothetical protein
VSPGHERRGLAAVCCLTLATVLWIVAWGNLANYFPVGGDEVLTLSASHKLATAGVLGSDLATGLYDAETSFFLNLPIQNLLQAAVFGVWGTGIWQARLPSLIAGVSLVGLASWFALRSFGWSVAILTAVTLVFWRSNLIGTEPRPPLLALSHSGRYDLLVVGLLWATIVLVYEGVARPRRTTAFMAGVCAALTALTQFYGIAAVAVMMIAYVMHWGRRTWREPVVRWSALGCLLTFLPYVVFVLLNLDAFTRQAALHGPRVDFLDPSFWLGNLLNETTRYQAVTDASAPTPGDRPLIGPWMFWLAAIPGIVPLIASSRGSGAQRALPWLSLAVPFGVLALAEQTKAVLYTSLIIPSLSLSLACALDALLRGRGVRQPLVRRVIQTASAMLLVVLIIEGWRGYRAAMHESRTVTAYLEIGRLIESMIPDDRPALGAWRWWWAVGGRRYFAVNGFWLNSERIFVSGEHPSFREEVQAKRASYLIVDRHFLGDLDRTVPTYRDAARHFIDSCSVVTGALDDGTYGRIEVRRISCLDERSPNVAE